MTPHSVPTLRRGIRRQYDATRQAHVLLGPERVIVLDDIAVEITNLIDGTQSIAGISEKLAEKFAADIAEVQPDVTAFIAELIEKGLATA